MSDIGGVVVNGAVRGQRGLAYGDKSQSRLSPDALEAFIVIADKITQKNILAEMKSNDILPIEENGFRAALYVVGTQPFLLMRPLNDPSESYVFDPVAKTFLGGIGSVFTAMHSKVKRESDCIEKIEKGLRDNEGLVAKYVEANSIHLIAKAVEIRQQVALEFLSLKHAAEKINVPVPQYARQQLAELCGLIVSPKKEAVAAPCQPAKGGMFAWLARVFE